MPGAMNKANARQHSNGKSKYEQQKLRTARNKERNVKRQQKLVARTARRKKAADK